MSYKSANGNNSSYNVADVTILPYSFLKKFFTLLPVIKILSCLWSYSSKEQAPRVMIVINPSEFICDMRLCIILVNICLLYLVFLLHLFTSLQEFSGIFIFILLQRLILPFFLEFIFFSQSLILRLQITFSCIKSIFPQPFFDGLNCLNLNDSSRLTTFKYQNIELTTNVCCISPQTVCPFFMNSYPSQFWFTSGLTTANASKILQGQHEYELTDRGVLQVTYSFYFTYIQ